MCVFVRANYVRANYVCAYVKNTYKHNKKNHFNFFRDDCMYKRVNFCHNLFCG